MVNPAPALQPVPETDLPGFADQGQPSRHQAAGDALARRWQQARAEAAEGNPVLLPVADLALWASRFTADEIDAYVIPKRTLVRRRASREPLTAEETDKALRLARIASEADRVFANPEKAARWLRRPASPLSGHTPLELLRSEAGALAVDDLLGQIDHGHFA